MPNEPQEFWNYSLQLYKQEGVAAACLELQDAYQLDVNLILFCFWYGSAYGDLDQGLLQNTVELSIEWRAHVVQPLRNARTWMKLNPSPSGKFTSLRESIKADELIAEKYQQEEMASLASEFNRGRQCLRGIDDIGGNIERLLNALKIERDEKITSRIGILRSALAGQIAGG